MALFTLCAKVNTSPGVLVQKLELRLHSRLPDRQLCLLFYISPVRLHFETWAQRSGSYWLPKQWIGVGKRCEYRCPVLSLVPKYKVIRQYTRVPHLYPKAGVGNWNDGVFTPAPSRNRTQAQSPQHQVWTYQRRLSLTHNSTLYDLSLRHSWWKKRPVQQDGTDIKSMLTERRHFLSAPEGRVARLSVRTNEARGQGGYVAARLSNEQLLKVGSVVVQYDKAWRSKRALHLNE